MVSARTFEQLEFVVRHVKKKPLVFGGIQVVAVGDWWQLSPVPNMEIRDDGKHCFLSDVFKRTFKHKLTLSKVLRQSDVQLIKSINELERGCASQETIEFIQSLSRPFVPQHGSSTFLFGTNFEVDWHNANKLSEMPGHIQRYHCEDSGNSDKLKRITAKKTLCLKINAPVLLLKNLGEGGFVNGLIGNVQTLDADGPTVKFSNGTLKLRKETFGVYCGTTKRNIAERIQFPLSLAFAMTIHKAQGMTLPNLVINCRNIFSPGQCGVALGRAVSSETVQVVSFSKECIKKHPAEVEGFYEEVGEPVQDDLTCCQDLTVGHRVDGRDEVATIQFDDSDDSDFDEAVLKEIDHFETAHFPKHLDTPAGEEEDSGGQFSVNDTCSILESLKNSEVCTQEQTNFNKAVDYVMTTPHRLRSFFNEQIQQIRTMLCEDHSSAVRKMTSFLSKYHHHVSSEGFTTACKCLFHPAPPNKLLCASIASAIRKKVVELEQMEKVGSELSASTPVEIPQTGYSKVRYVAGFTVAKVKHYNMNRVRNGLSSNSYVMDRVAKTKVDLLQSVIVQQSDILNTSKYPDSLTDISRKQSLTFGLTNISDDVFEFFLKLEKKRLPLYSSKNLKGHGSMLLSMIHSTLKKDEALLNNFLEILNTSTAGSGDSVAETNDSSEEECNDINRQLFRSVVDKYLNVTDAEFRRKLLSEKRKRSLEHRKQVLVSKQSSSGTTASSSVKGKSLKLTMASIREDKTHMKEGSHRLLTGIIMQGNKSEFNSFTKVELMIIGSAYDLSLQKHMKKDLMIMKLTEKIQSSDGMVHVSTFETNAGEGETQDTQTEEEELVGNKSGKGKRKGKGKGKGKGQGNIKPKQRRTQSSKEDNDQCRVCDGLFGDDEDEPWICCTFCDSWYHRSCGGIKGSKEWEQVSGEGAYWLCPMCS